jgi:hypothetical protein
MKTLMSNFSTKSPGFDPKLVYARVLVDKVIPGQVSPVVLFVCPPVLCFDIGMNSNSCQHHYLTHFEQ